MDFWLKRNLKTSGKSKELCSKIQIEDLEITLIRKDVRGLRLSIKPDGEIRLSLPHRLSDSDAETFVSSRLPWIRKHMVRIDKLKGLEPDDLSSALFLGQSYKTAVFHHPIAPRVVIDSSERMCIFLKPGTPETEKASVLDAWYRSELKKMIPPLIKEWEPIMGVEVKTLKFKRMKTRWGTCNVVDHRIWLNVELAKNSYPCIE